MNTRPGLASLFGWALAILAVLSWCAFGYAAFRLHASAQALEAQKMSAIESGARSASALRIEEVLDETTTERAVLAGVLSPELLAIADMIEAVGPLSGAELSIGNATRQSDVGSPDAPIHVVTVVARAEGTFAEIIHALALLETLPAPVSLDEFELEHASQKGASWDATIRLRIFTSSQLPV